MVKTIVFTVEVSMNKIEPKLVQCRILAITLPSDILHQATPTQPFFQYIITSWCHCWLSLHTLSTFFLKSFSFSGPSKWMDIQHRRGDKLPRSGLLLVWKWAALEFHIQMRPFKDFGKILSRKCTRNTGYSQQRTFHQYWQAYYIKQIYLVCRSTSNGLALNNGEWQETIKPWNQLIGLSLCAATDLLATMKLPESHGILQLLLVTQTTARSSHFQPRMRLYLKPGISLLSLNFWKLMISLDDTVSKRQITEHRITKLGIIERWITERQIIEHRKLPNFKSGNVKLSNAELLNSQSYWTSNRQKLN